MSTYTHIDVSPDGNSIPRHWADRRSPDVRAFVPVFPSAFLAGLGPFRHRRRNRPIGKGRSVLAATLFALGLVVGLAAPTDVKAAIFHKDEAGFLAGFNVTPALGTTTDAVYSDDSNTDVGSQSPANVEMVLESMAWFDTELTLVGGGGGNCGAFPVFENGCSASENVTNSGESSLTANVFGVHFDNFFLAFLYPGPVSNFSIDGLPNGVSNIYAYNTSVVPLPAALPLFLSALAGLGLIGWRRKRMAA